MACFMMEQVIELCRSRLKPIVDFAMGVRPSRGVIAEGVHRRSQHRKSRLCPDDRQRGTGVVKPSRFNPRFMDQ